MERPGVAGGCQVSQGAGEHMPARDFYHETVPGLVVPGVFEEPVGQLLLEDGSIKVIVFDENSEEVVRWIG